MFNPAAKVLPCALLFFSTCLKVIQRWRVLEAVFNRREAFACDENWETGLFIDQK